MRLKFSNNAKYVYLTEKPKRMPAYFLKSVAYNLLSNLITAQDLDLELGGGGLVAGFGFGNFGILCVRLKKVWLATPLFENSASLRHTNPSSETNAVPTRNEGLTVPTEQKTVKYLVDTTTQSSSCNNHINNNCHSSWYPYHAMKTKDRSISHNMQRYHPLVT